jgi:exoribonuclease-2
MERYWTLRYLQQEHITELDATVFKDQLARADSLPLVLPVMGTQDLPRGARVRVRLGTIDLLALDVSGTVLSRLDTIAAADVEQALDEDEGEDVGAGPITIAVDLSEPAEETPANKDNAAT